MLPKSSQMEPSGRSRQSSSIQVRSRSTGIGSRSSTMSGPERPRPTCSKLRCAGGTSRCRRPELELVGEGVAGRDRRHRQCGTPSIAFGTRMPCQWMVVSLALAVLDDHPQAIALATANLGDPAPIRHRSDIGFGCGPPTSGRRAGRATSRVSARDAACSSRGIAAASARPAPLCKAVRLDIGIRDGKEYLHSGCDAPIETFEGGKVKRRRWTSPALWATCMSTATSVRGWRGGEFSGKVADMGSRVACVVCFLFALAACGDLASLPRPPTEAEQCRAWAGARRPGLPACLPPRPSLDHVPDFRIDRGRDLPPTPAGEMRPRQSCAAGWRPRSLRRGQS